MRKTYILVTAIVGVIFLLPNLLFYIEDYQREHAITEVSKQQLISMEVDDMYLVNQLHYLDYQSIDYLYDLDIQEKRHEDFVNEVKKMKDFGLIKEDVWNKFTTIQEKNDYKAYIFNRTYSYEESYTTQDNDMFVGDILMDAKTSKILKFYLISDEPLTKDEAFMKKYIQYLGLDVIDDWQLTTAEVDGTQTSYMVSKKAQLKVYTDTDRIVMLQDSGYHYMYRILFRVDTLQNEAHLYIKE